MARFRFFTGLNLVLLGVLLSVPALMSDSRTVEANHIKSDYLRSIRRIGSGYNQWADEDYCVDVTYTTLDFATAKSRIQNTLIYDRTDVNWDMKLGGYTDFYTSSLSCSQLSGAQRQAMDLEFHVMDTVQGFAPYYRADACGGTSCVVPYGDSSGGPYGRTEWQWYDLFLRGQYMKDLGDGTGQSGPDRRRHLINHETGHVLGLADGYKPDCPVSVMHPYYYGCPYNYPWPSLDLDHPSVNRIIYGQP